MELGIGIDIISSYKRLSYTAWHAFAEYVDNSTQAYFNNKELLDSVFEKEGENLYVKINYSPTDDFISIEDNSIGMNHDELENALHIGRKPENTSGRSKYGMGLKTASCWMGDKWTVKTKKLGETEAYEVTVDVNKIVEVKDGDVEEIIHENQDPEDHYTIIEITELNQSFHGNTIHKIKEHLMSIYRIDFESYGLKLYWQGDPLEWTDFKDRLYELKDGSPYYHEFEFSINNKNVNGWVGVLGPKNSGRKNAGFSIIQANRVVEGWPKGYKPSKIFGDQEDGRNDLVNQRVVGELYLNGFEISHTKDKIIWLDDELEKLNENLFDESKEAIHMAKNLRYKEESSNGSSYVSEALDILETEVTSVEAENYISKIDTETPSNEYLHNSYERLIERETSRNPSLNVNIGETNPINVLVYFTEQSEFEPYVVIEATGDENKVIVVINRVHPHFKKMNNEETVTNFIRHCIYDGVSEWKALNLRGEIDPDTVKYLKDGLLRLQYQIQI